MFKKIAQTIRKIPKGKVATYGDVAYAAGFPGSARQVAWALHQSRGLPWQRVVGSEGKILLPSEAGFEQRMRLQQEGVQFLGLRVNMKLHRHVWFTKQRKKKSSVRPNRRKRT